MKRFFLLVLLLALCMPGFGALSQKATPALTEADFSFVLDGVTYALGDPAAPMIEAVEKAYGLMQVLAVPSCLFQGEDKEFESDEILLGTYPIGAGGADQLESILFIGGEHETSRGIRLGMRLEDVTAAYGGEYTLEEGELIYVAEELLTMPELVFTFDLDTGLLVGFFMMRNSG